MSKNNQNIRRLNLISDIFPCSKILIPFRDPLQQALSLFSQHMKFVKAQNEDVFVRDYMTWIGHSEFGLDYKMIHPSNLLYPNEKEFNHILKYLDKIAPLIIRLKEYWNRARPYQYANLIEAPLYPMTTFSGHSPSYPSGHTLQGYVWARLITTIKPELKEWSESIATKINLSRIALGVHFPSDIDFSKKIYKDIVSSKLI